MSLKDKLHKISTNQPNDPIDWEAKKVNWIRSIGSLFKELELWFCEYLDEGYMKMAWTQKPITEENIGSYEVPVLAFVFGENRLIFEPIGINIIGSLGRIDVYIRGRKVDKYFLLLQEQDEDHNTWILISVNNPQNQIPYNKENFETILENWIDKYSI